jgi:hypothetical protein
VAGRLREPYLNDEAVFAQFSAEHILAILHRLPVPVPGGVQFIRARRVLPRRDLPGPGLTWTESTSRSHACRSANRLLRQALVGPKRRKTMHDPMKRNSTTGWGGPGGVTGPSPARRLGSGCAGPCAGGSGGAWGSGHTLRAVGPAGRANGWPKTPVSGDGSNGSTGTPRRSPAPPYGKHRSRPKPIRGRCRPRRSRW